MIKFTKTHLFVFLVLITFHTALFWVSDIDLLVAEAFYYPEQSNVWPLGEQPIWRFFYYLAPVLTLSIVISTLLVIAFSMFKASWRIYRYQAIFILLCFVLGPGLIVNSLFKDHWGRPRPINIEAFGGTEQYVPPLKYNVAGNGKSFPSGHTSLGFAFIAFWFIWRKRRPLWAKSAFIFSISLGGLFAISRMSAGGHFLSDVFWSLWIPLLSSIGLYALFQKYLEDEVTPVFKQRASFWKKMLYSLMVLTLLGYGLSNWPLKQEQVFQFKSSPHLKITMDTANLSIIYGNRDATLIKIHHELEGIGSPFSQQALRVSTQQMIPKGQSKPITVTHIHLKAKGFFKDLDSDVTLILPPKHTIEQFDVQIKKGKVKSELSIINRILP